MVDHASALKKAEVAKQFNSLPERQAKVNLLIKALEGELKDENQVYCLCRTTDTDRFMICCDNCEEWFHGDCISITERESKAIKKFYCVVCQDRNPSLHIKFKIKKNSHRKKWSMYSESSDSDARRREAAKKRSSRMCGICDSCRRTEDCRKCDFCQDMRKFGGPNKMRQKCRLRQCVNMSRVSQKLFLNKELRDKIAVPHLEEHTYTSNVCGTEELWELGPQPQKRRTQSDDDSDYHYKPSTTKQKKRSVKLKHTTKVGRKPKHMTKVGPRSNRVHTTESAMDDMLPPIDIIDAPKQCNGPGCINTTRESSKYCSEDCGLKLATNRIYEFLPLRLEQWQQTPCIAEELGKKTLEKIRAEQHTAQKHLTELNDKANKLDTLIMKVKKIPIAIEDENTDGEDETELNIDCVTCGHPVGVRHAVRHMARCFAKYESQTTFGASFTTKVTDGIFCDNYNKLTNTYCKRLRVLCPEHTKDPKIADDEVCGSPLVTDVFTETGRFCRSPKRKCIKHFQWEKLHRAEIDVERVNVWCKLDELFEQERNVRIGMAQRASLLALLLHQTVNHDLIPPSSGSDVKLHQHSTSDVPDNKYPPTP